MAAATMEADFIAQKWYLSAKGIEQCLANPTSNSGSNVKAGIQRALNLDLKNIGAAIIPDDPTRCRKEPKLADCVLQVSSVTNVSAPKSNPESNSSPRLLRVELTDGHSTISALALRTLDGLGLKTPPGTKLKLKLGKMQFQHGFFVLSEQHMDVLGGTVEDLVEKWKLEQAHANYSSSTRKTGSEAGPPKWVPFGQKVVTGDVAEITGKFKSLDPTGSKEREMKEDGTFELQRKATIAEATKAGPKVFGGKKEIIDRDVGSRASRGRFDDSRSARGPSAHVTGEISRNERSSKFGRKGRGDRDRDGDDLLVSTAPSRPSTLFDFLESKISNVSNSKNASNGDPANRSSGDVVGRSGQPFGAESSRWNVSRERSARNDSDSLNRQTRRPSSEQPSQSCRTAEKSRSAHDMFPSNSNRADGNSYRPPKSSATGDANSFTGGRMTYGRRDTRRGESGSSKFQSSNSYDEAGRKSGDLRNNGYVEVKNFVAANKSPSDGELPNSHRSPAFKTGDTCIAKYWEDNKFYPAVVHAIAPGGSTCVVLFPQYGNYEEVLLKDVVPSNDSRAKNGNGGRGGANNRAITMPSGDPGFRRRNTRPPVMSNPVENQLAFGRPARQVYLPPAQRP